jgi:hypothetical protein
MASAGKILALVFAVAIAAYVFVPAAGAVFSDNTNQLDQALNEEVDVTGNVTSNVTSITSTDATYEVSDGSTTVTETISEGSNTTVTLTEGDITITNDGTDTTNDTVNTTYEYSGTYGWSNGASSLVGVLVIFAMLAIAVVLGLPALEEL